MLAYRRPVLLAAAMLALPAAAPPATNLFRDAFSPIVPLEAGKAAELKGVTDGDEPVVARLTLADDGTLAKAEAMQDGQILLLPPSAIQGLSGAKRGWLEERGALTTLVIEGTEKAKTWRLALEFHPKQLWLRRVSREGQARDEFTYYDRRDLAAQKLDRRRHHVRGFNTDK